MATAASENPQSLPQYFDFSTEADIYQQWEDSGLFGPRQPREGDGPDDAFVVMMPPPNVTGRLHMGHAIGSALQDIMVRCAPHAGWVYVTVVAYCLASMR